MQGAVATSVAAFVGALRSVVRLAPAEKLALAKLLWVLVLVEVGIRLVPLTSFADWLGVPLRRSRSGLEGSGEAGVRLNATERHHVRMLDQLLVRWPFGHGPCLRRSLVLGHILRRQGLTLRLGVAESGGRVLAHAWLEADGASLEGDHGFLALTEAAR